VGCVPPVLNQMIFKVHQVSEGGKEFIRFMMEEEQYGPWMQAGIGYVAHPLAAYAKNPIWTVDPKHHAVPRRGEEHAPAAVMKASSATASARSRHFIIVDMVAEAAAGAKSPKEAAERAQKRAERYYKVEAASGEQERPRAAVHAARGALCSPSSPTRSAWHLARLPPMPDSDALASG